MGRIYHSLISQQNLSLFIRNVSEMSYILRLGFDNGNDMGDIITLDKDLTIEKLQELYKLFNYGTREPVNFQGVSKSTNMFFNNSTYGAYTPLPECNFEYDDIRINMVYVYNGMLNISIQYQDGTKITIPTKFDKEYVSETINNLIQNKYKL